MIENKVNGRNLMGRFLQDLLSFGIEGATAYISTKRKVVQLKELLTRLTSDEEVPIEEFIKAYDERMYNFDSSRDDIKILKQIDFEGAYIIHNVTKDIYQVGISSKVMRKVDRYFRGFEKIAVYNDWEHGDVFAVRFVRLDNSEYNNINVLKNDLVNKYGFYVYPTKIDSDVLRLKKKKKTMHVALICIILIMSISFMVKYRIDKQRIAQEGKINAGYYKNYIGKDFIEVQKELIEIGFDNIELIDLEDSKWAFWRNEEVKEVCIDGKSNFDSSDWFEANDKVIISYH